MTKLWSLLMLKLTRLIVAIKNARKERKEIADEIFFNTELLALTYDSEIFGTPARRKKIKEICESHDYCERCELFDTFDNECLFADDDEGIPCYWEEEE